MGCLNLDDFTDDYLLQMCGVQMARKKKVARGRATSLKDVLDCRPKVELPEFLAVRINGFDPSDDEDYEEDPQYMYGDMTQQLGFFKTEEEAMEAVKNNSQYNNAVYRIFRTYKQFKAIQQEPILQEIND
jgi:hypothetical protein